MPRLLAAAALAAAALVFATGTPFANAAARDRVADMEVNDLGSHVEWAPVVCLARRAKLRFEVKHKNLRTEDTLIYDGWSRKRQGKGCRRHRLRLDESSFVVGDEYRTVLTVYLRSKFITSKYRTFTVR